jgi:hypothetical protein
LLGILSAIIPPKGEEFMRYYKIIRGLQNIFNTRLPNASVKA